ncbi:accessory Sec system protein Asp1 [Streptococcus oricebi]|uniref:Accessory Sec system protein Asp1 n=1 Tax=Streptococcus oricebi TaxID=1547447 RepID=A0ABS5B2A2_9STRE|nr:accessory Sec system protein Asp1 [Streptococcus oricebi]MBP2622967.1 accessory Sec system protein Asp1 [Streptococcus oricebi]
MYYVIPAWYGQERAWQMDLLPWYRTVQRLEFDDSIHQLRILQELGQGQILLLAYMPQLRYFLHRQDIYETKVYSVFDDLQDIQSDQMQVLQIKDFSWPSDCDFIYTPFLVMVYRQDQLYAHIEFGQEGFISQLKFFENQSLSQVQLLDDRGFVSSILYYDGDRLSHQDYLNPQGDWRFRRYEDGKSPHALVINPRYQTDFKAPSYQSWEDLIFERLADHLAGLQLAESNFILAAHPNHQEALFNLFPPEAAKILSFFVDRNRLEELDQLGALIERADLVLTDRKDLLAGLNEHFPAAKAKFHHSPSFDSRLQLGLSQRRKESKIYYQLDLNQILNEYALFKILQFVGQNPLTELVLAVYNGQEEGLKRVEAKVWELIEDYLKPEDFIKKASKNPQSENQLEENQEIVYRLEVKNITDELSLIQELEYSRLIVDLNQEPHLYTQLAGISAGLPQINLVASEYVSHLENGYILSEIAELPQVANYYLEGLKNWNQALVYSIDKIAQHTGQQLIERWQTWLGEVEHGR